ncbi:MAG TPA: PEGA domain-containing protein [Nitrospirota bacterium]|nr:PEGA domain-containing protein [Nitrospirota bacterium]
MKKIILAFLAVLAIAVTAGDGLCEGPKVAVFPFKNNGQPQQTGLASGIAAMFTTNIANSRALDAVDPQRVMGSVARARLLGGAPSFEDALKAAAELQADYAVMGEFVVFGSRFRIDIRVYDVKAGTLKMADKAQAKEDALFEAVDQLSEEVVLAITGTLPEAAGGLKVTSEPSGATVRVDDEKTGETPALIRDIAPGSHKVELELTGYQVYSETVVVKAKETAKLDAKLVRLMGGMRVWWKGLPTSDITVGGDSIPITHFQGIYVGFKYCRNIPSGTYRVAVRLPYKDETAWDMTRTWKTYTAEVEIGPGGVTDIFINNNPNSPRVEVGNCGSCAAGWDFTTKMSWFE